MYAFQTQLFTTVQEGIQWMLYLLQDFLSVWRVQVWTSQPRSISQHLRSSSQEALWLWTVQYTLGPVMENTVFTGSNTLKNLIQDSFPSMEAEIRHKHTPVSTTCQWGAWIVLMLGPMTVLLLHVDTCCLETGPRWTLRVSNSLADTVPHQTEWKKKTSEEFCFWYLSLCRQSGLSCLGVFLERSFDTHHHPGSFTGFLSVPDEEESKLLRYGHFIYLTAFSYWIWHFNKKEIVFPHQRLNWDLQLALHQMQRWIEHCWQ